ncbi:MAG: S-methyl-5-thioribose-1-phosphate isomerase [Burkholderiales bacterium]
MTIDTLRWRDGALELLDQRALPNRVEYLRYTKAEGVAQAIKDLVVRGAPAIGCAAAYGMALAGAACVASPGDTAFILRKAHDAMADSRPTAVNLFWALARQRRIWEQVGNAIVLAENLLAEAHAILREDLAMNRAMGAHGAALIPEGARILTHCNAGALATAGHGTALGVIRSAIEAGKKLSVTSCETRPVLQGARLTVWELMQDGIPVTLIPDNSAAHIMSRGEIDLVIVGADRIALNGDTANKIGTYMHAVCAARHGIPFYVAAPCSSIDPKLKNGTAIPIEERAAAEVTGYGKERWAPEGVKVRNPAFDVTPAELISAIVTEKGVIRPPFEDTLSRWYA